jgi:hypothetical protein
MMKTFRFCISIPSGTRCATMPYGKGAGRKTAAGKTSAVTLAAGVLKTGIF